VGVYAIVLSLHSLNRWLVLGTALFAIARAVSGLGGRPYDATDRKASLAFTITTDVQLLLGLAMQFVLSDYTRSLMGNMKASMKDPVSRFWAVEHVTAMILAVALVHVGSVRAKKAKDDAGKHKGALIFYGLGLVVMLLSVPWPFRAAGRAWLRLP